MKICVVTRDGKELIQYESAVIPRDGEEINIGTGFWYVLQVTHFATFPIGSGGVNDQIGIVVSPVRFMP